MAGGALAPFLSGWNASKRSLSTTTDRRAPSVERSGASQVFVALEQRHRPVDQDTHLRAEIAVWRIDHVDGDRRRAPILEQRHESARRDGLMNGVRRRLNDSQARQTCCQVRVGVVNDRPGLAYAPWYLKEGLRANVVTNLRPSSPSWASYGATVACRRKFRRST